MDFISFFQLPTIISSVHIFAVPFSSWCSNLFPLVFFSKFSRSLIYYFTTANSRFLLVFSTFFSNFKPNKSCKIKKSFYQLVERLKSFTNASETDLQRFRTAANHLKQDSVLSRGEKEDMIFSSSLSLDKILFYAVNRDSKLPNSDLKLHGFFRILYLQEEIKMAAEEAVKTFLQSKLDKKIVFITVILPIQ